MAKARTSGKSAPTPDEPVHCPECGRNYQQSELVRRSWSSPGIKRPGGGPNGAWRAVWRCCPEGHKLIQVSFRIS